MRRGPCVWKNVWLLALGVLLACAHTVLAATIVLPCVSATYARESNDDYSYGDEADLHIRHDATSPYDRNCFLKFDLSSIPSDACIISAKLRLYQYDSTYMSDDDWLKVAAYRLLRDWQEGPNGRLAGACWLYRTAGTSNPWYSPGARSNVDRKAGAPDSVVTCYRIPVGGSGRWVEWDVTPSAQFWHRNPSQNYGLCLDKWLEGRYSYDDNEWLYFWSEDYGDPFYRPVLVVEYIIPGQQPAVALGYTSLELNYWDSDPNVTVYWDNTGQARCEGFTSVSGAGWDGCRSTFVLNSGFQCDIKVKLEQGCVGVQNGAYSFVMWEDADKYIRLTAVGAGQYYEINGKCAAVGCGARHDGTAYWSSYVDGGCPSGPPSGSVVFFSETPSDEQVSYITWRIRYDKANKVFLAYVIDGTTEKLVAYYSDVDFANFRLGVAHSNDANSVQTRIWTRFPDATPPSPDPMDWLVAPHAVSTTAISMTAVAAVDDSPPIAYYFQEVTGNPGGSSSHWMVDNVYLDAGLSPNTRYGYRVKARDSAEPKNETQFSSTVYCYTFMPDPTACRAGNVTATTVELSALGSFPNLDEGLTGTKFESVSGDWQGSWRLHSTTDQATGLIPNTLYTFRVKARNGDGIETNWAAETATVRTLAARPAPLPYGPVTSRVVQVNWSANGNPPGTEYLCRELTTGRDSGWITQTNWVVTGLEPNTLYHFQVVARNAEGKVTEATDLGPVMTPETIGQVKLSHNVGERVVLRGKLVTAVFAQTSQPAQKSLVFVQDWSPVPAMLPDWASGIGIRLELPGIVIKEGDILDVQGILVWNDPPYEQEVVVLPERVTVVGWSPVPQRPYGGSNRGIGGGDFGCQPGVFDDVTCDPAVASCGLNTVGTLVRVWGRVRPSYSDPENSCIYVWDGSMLRDGVGEGVRVYLRHLGGSPPPNLVGYCSVTGIMRCVMSPTGHNVRELWPRRMTDIVSYTGVQPAGP
ncbi:MAG: DNRLRE domain-containing protein [Armatimonadota bacterium]|nr:DNRLRE domain-containing protein [Armatimonadota bacterium]